jgi:acetylornithine deacetylase
VGQINAGIAPNVIADKSLFKWDVRVIPQDVTEDIIAEFETYCRERESILRETFPEFEIKNAQHHPPVPPLDTDESDDIVALIKSISPIQETGTVAYAAEAGQFSNGGFQSVICGPGSIAQAHRANEFIEIEQLDMGVEMIRKLVGKLAI